MMLAHAPVVLMGGGFPWGLLILGGIAYLLWRNGMFGGPGRHGNPPGQRFGGYGGDYRPAPMPEQPQQGQEWSNVFRGPREVFEEWHREAHAADRPQAPAPPAPPAAPASEAPGAGTGEAAR